MISGTAGALCFAPFAQPFAFFAVKSFLFNAEGAKDLALLEVPLTDWHPPLTKKKNPL